MGVYYRPPDQDQVIPPDTHQVDEALYKQIGAASHSQNVVLMGDFNYLYICWRDNIAVHQK